MGEKTVEQKDFNLRLESASDTVRLSYYDLLAQKRAEMVKENKGGLVDVSISEREELLAKAKTIALYGNVDPKKMKEDWEAATSAKGRPPIGGAQDD